MSIVKEYILHITFLVGLDALQLLKTYLLIWEICLCIAFSQSDEEIDSNAIFTESVLSLA